ncbi:hypothetical protein F5141DRAFT_33276 [Pisolithus sp. B1]|nr:hypothetical protein F5141DRAFT_33276 [Pisolithus sp. B1]
MPWYKRRAVSICNLTLSIKHYTDDDGVERIDVDQKLSGGFSGGSDNHILDWQERRCNDDVFGPLIYKTRRVSLELIEDESLRLAGPRTPLQTVSFTQLPGMIPRTATVTTRGRYGVSSSLMAKDSMLGSPHSPQTRRMVQFAFAWFTSIPGKTENASLARHFKNITVSLTSYPTVACLP